MMGRITVLVEDTASRRGMLAEHGLAFWIALALPRRLDFAPNFPDNVPLVRQGRS